MKSYSSMLYILRTENRCIKHFPKLFCLFFLFLFSGYTGSSQAFVVHYPVSFPPEAAADLQNLLAKATGKTWGLATNAKEAATGFILVQNASRSYKTGESAYITSDGASFVRVEAPTTNGLIYGAYKYLRNIGFNFYLPDDLYTEYPTGGSIYKKTSVMETPAFRIRDFFGTGGLGSGKTDPGLQVQKAWQLWKWRNGFGSEFQLSGHVGETFNLDNAAKLEKNPDWTATPIKKNGQVNANTRLNYFNQEAVDYFTDWVLKKFTAKDYTPPPAYITDLVSIEPADGGSYITQVPPKSALKSAAPSDQVFYAANVAAKKLEKLFPNQPNIGVNLYAYSDHADVPSFPLHKRVFVQIIPYQFQNVSYGPAFIKRWASTAKRFGIYDYFKYPDASWDLPGGFSLAEIMNRAVYAGRAGSQGTTYESSYSKFSTAIPLWILVRYLADGDQNWQNNYSRLITALFKDSKVPVTKIFNLFYQTPQFSQLQMPAIYELMEQAQSIVKDAAERKRLGELKAYITYVAAYYGVQNNTAASLETNLLPIGQLAWTLYQSKVIDSYRIMQLVSYSFLNANAGSETQKSRYQQLHLLTFPESDEPLALWRKDWALKPANLEQLYKKGFSKNTASTPGAVQSISIEKQLILSKLQLRPKAETLIQSDYTVRGYLSIYAEKPTTITVNWNLQSTSNTVPGLTISGMDPSYQNIYDERLEGNHGRVQLNIGKGKTDLFMNVTPNTTYTISVNFNGGYAFFEGSPRGKMNFMAAEKKSTYEAPLYPSYFFVPQNTGTVQFKVQSNALQIYDPQDNLVPTSLVAREGDFEIRQFTVPARYQNNFYKLHVSGNYNYQLLNIPDRYFLLDKK